MKKRLLLCSALVVATLAGHVPSFVSSQPVSVVGTQSDSKKQTDIPYVTLPATRKVRPNRYFSLKATTNCTNIKWIIPPGLEQLDSNIELKNPNILVLIGDTGTYTVSVYGALAGTPSDIASCVVTIGNPPTPPVPPTPPAPNPLTQVFQAAYNLDSDSNRVKSLDFLQEVYLGMAGQAPSWSDVKTNSDAVAKMKVIVEAPGVGLTSTQVVNLRKAIGSELAKTFGTTTTTPISLTALSSELTNIATALKGVN